MKMLIRSFAMSFLRMVGHHTHEDVDQEFYQFPNGRTHP